MRSKSFFLLMTLLVTLTAGGAFMMHPLGHGPAVERSGDPRSGDKIEMTLSCPECNQLMTGTFRYCNNATTTVICSHCHKHWLVHYDWVSDPESAKAGHWQYKLRILSVKKS